MEWKIILFGIVCIGILGCMWRGGPCSIFWKRCKDKLLNKRSYFMNNAIINPASPNESRP
jgi:hypothetical protein